MPMRITWQPWSKTPGTRSRGSRRVEAKSSRSSGCKDVSQRLSAAQHRAWTQIAKTTPCKVTYGGQFWTPIPGLGGQYCRPNDIHHRPRRRVHGLPIDHESFFLCGIGRFRPMSELTPHLVTSGREVDDTIGGA